jgi:hypothetical protein
MHIIQQGGAAADQNLTTSALSSTRARERQTGEREGRREHGLCGALARSAALGESQSSEPEVTYAHFWLAGRTGRPAGLG